MEMVQLIKHKDLSSSPRNQVKMLGKVTNTNIGHYLRNNT